VSGERHLEAEVASLSIPAVPLSDGVICLRTWRDADAEAVAAACQDPMTQQYIPIPRPYGHADAVAYIERTRRQWDEGVKAAFAVADAADPSVLLGAINMALFGATGNAAYWVVPAMRNQGIAGRALGLITDWALPTIPLAVVILEIRPENVASQRVAVAAGYHPVGRLDVNEVTGDVGGLIYARFT
jgi:RimJ/RimL family protein N-acetyltransferase